MSESVALVVVPPPHAGALLANGGRAVTPFNHDGNPPKADIDVEAAALEAAASVKPPLIDVKEFAAKLGCCPKHIRRMADSGRCPPPIHLGGLRRWNRQVVDDWIAAGCPVVRQARINGRK